MAVRSSLEGFPLPPLRFAPQQLLPKAAAASSYFQTSAFTLPSTLAAAAMAAAELHSPSPAAVILVVLCFLAAAVADDDMLGLIVFKADVADPGGALVSWSEDDESPCRWRGVSCDSGTGRVTGVQLDGLSLSGKLGRGLLRLVSLSTLSLANNNLTGELPPELLGLEALRRVDLSGNSLSGAIPDGFFSKCRVVREVSLAGNSFSGGIPADVGRCATLAALDLSNNQLSGPLPGSVWSLNALRSLDLSANAISGEVPVGIGKMFNLRSVSLRSNRLSGKLPDDIGDCPLLRSVDLSENALSGELPESLRRLTACARLDLHSNLLSGELPTWIGEMWALESLDLSTNRLSGELPSSLAQLKALKELNLSRNGFTGRPPESLSWCPALAAVDISWNSLTGGLPSWALTVERLSLSNNILSGALQVPANASPAVRAVDLSCNAFSGVIPPETANLSGLRSLNLSWNSLSGGIPDAVGMLSSLEVLDLTANRLNGTVPAAVGSLQLLRELRLGRNALSGGIPAAIGNCSALTALDLSQNGLAGEVPVAVGDLAALETVDLSRNKLYGTLPKKLADLPHIRSFNVSHNRLSGELPPGGFFNSIPPSSLADNAGLCGAPVNVSCPAVLPKPIVLNPNSSSDASSSPEEAVEPTGVHRSKFILSVSTIVAIAGAAVIAIGVITVTVLNFRVHTAGISQAATGAGADLSEHSGSYTDSPTTGMNSGKLVMFGGGSPEFSASTHALLNKDCELGRGGFGTVYRTYLRDGQPVAIKKLTVSSLVKSQDDFEREVKLLGKLRHRNLVALRGYYWTPSLQLLIYDFVGGSNLYQQLHGDAGAVLSWKERFDVVLGVARSIAHLHRHDVVHYNIKSSNVLLDAAGEAKVGDYGLAKLLPMLDRYVLSSKVQSALGYMAPEFACSGVRITDKIDVYSFGVLVLETLTGRKPVEYMEDDVAVLCDVVRSALDDGSVEECIDGRLCGKFPMEEAVPAVKLGLVCTSTVPSNRPEMAEVVSILELIRCPEDSPDGELG